MQINTGSPLVYILILVVGCAIFLIFPFIVYMKRKPSWKDPNTTFEPFDWQIEHRHPNQVSKWPAGYVPSEQQIENAIMREADDFKGKPVPEPVIAAPATTAAPAEAPKATPAADTEKSVEDPTTTKN